MLSFVDCAIAEDRNLVWTTMPVLKPNMMLPLAVLKHMGVQHPPPARHVFTHVLNLTVDANAGGLLDRWPFDEVQSLPLSLIVSHNLVYTPLVTCLLL